MTQSCLGKHMAELESETGLELINHDSKRVSLAPAGKYFAQETSTMIAVWEDCLRRCKEIQKQAQESLSIAIFLEGNPSNDILFQLGRDYHKERKGVEVTFSKLVGANPIESLNDGSFDVTIDLCFGDCSHYANALSESGISTLKLQSSPLVIWFRNDNRIARNSNIQLEDLERIPIMTSVSSSYDYMRAATKRLYRFSSFRAQDCKTTITHRCRSFPKGISSKRSATPRQRHSITMRSVCTLEIASGHRPHPKPNSYPARFSVTFPRSAV